MHWPDRLVDIIQAAGHPRGVIRRPDSSGRLLRGLLAVLLTVPLGIVVHHHEADHDGGVPHLEVPHGGHDSPAPELYDRITSSAPDAPMAPLSTRQPAADADFTAAIEAVAVERADHPPRPPPAPTQSRAPPIGS